MRGKPRRGWVVIGAIGLLGLLPGGWCCWGQGPSMVFELQCRCRVRTGMKLADVEAVLGPGQQREGPPMSKDDSGKVRPVIQGEEFYRWEGPNGEDFYIGLRGGKVCEKYFWRASL